MFNVTENMLFNLNKSSTQIALTKYYESPGNIFGKNCKKDLYLIHTLSMQKGLRSGIINFWLVVMVFLNFWLVVIPVERFLARGGSW